MKIEICPLCHGKLELFADGSIYCGICKDAWRDREKLESVVEKLHKKNDDSKYIDEELYSDLETLVAIAKKDVLVQVVETLNETLADMKAWKNKNSRADCGAIEWYTVDGAQSALTELRDGLVKGLGNGDGVSV